MTTTNYSTDVTPPPQSTQIGVMVEVAEQRDTMRALAKGEQKYSAIFEHSVDALFLFTDIIIDCNPAACRILACSKDDIIGKSPRVFLPSKQLNGRLTTRAIAELLQSVSSSYFQQTTLRCLRMNGQQFEAEISLIAIPLDGRIVYHAIVRDISARLKTETANQQLATAVSQSADGVVITNSNGIIEYVNPAFEKMTQYTASEAIGQNPRVLKSGKQANEFYQTLWETLKKGQTWHGQLSNRRKDGTLYTERMTISPVLDDAGICTHFVALKRDISYEVAMEQMLVQSQKMETVGRLAGGIAHDFNNLLTVITGYSEVLIDKFKDDQSSRDDAEEIRKAAERATSLTRQLLTFSRRQVAQRQSVDLNSLLSDMNKMLNRMIREDIALQMELSVENAFVLADPGQLEQIVMNLTVNAVDAMPNGGKLSISISKHEFEQGQQFDKFELSAGTYVALNVCDTGTGMTEETLGHIFEPFFTTKSIGKGTGLGLATVFGIVQQYGGGIDVKSELGVGTTFTVFLSHSSTLKPTSIDAVQSISHLGQGETILLVEDEPQVREFVHRLLIELNYKVITCETAMDAVNQALDPTVTFDLLLSDVIMPRMNGHQLVEHIRATKPDIPVLLMSGYTDNVISDAELAELKAQFIMKPFTREQLGTKMRKMLTYTRHNSALL